MVDSADSGAEVAFDVFPPWPLLPVTGGWLIAGVALVHVALAHAAIGGGFLFALAETLGLSADPSLRRLARRGTRLLIWISVVFGATTGVGIWFAIGLFHPAGTWTLLRVFVWLWAIEWVLFIVEIVAALAWDGTWGRIPDAIHRRLGWIYVVTAWLSLFVITGILSFMLTPGRWPVTGSVAAAFFNRGFASTVVLRTGVALMLGGAWGLFLASRETPAYRAPMARFVALWGLVGATVAAAGFAWWHRSLGPDMRAMFAEPGGLLYPTWLTMNWSLAAALAGLLVFGLILARWMNPAFAAVVVAAATMALGGFERVREGIRKPWIIHGVMYSNGIRADEVDALRESGFRSRASWIDLAVARDAPTGADETLRRVGGCIFRAQCAACHTRDGYLAIRPRVRGIGADGLAGILTVLDGMNPWMPPFAGDADDRRAVAAYLAALEDSP